MLHDDTEEGAPERFEIGLRFRRMIETRITRLEADASHDEDTANHLDNIDHIRRQGRQDESLCRLGFFAEDPGSAQ
jgi:hypothetical protein